MSASPRVESTQLPSLIDQLLAEQQSVAAVETFARHHDDGVLSPELKVYEERFRIDHSALRPGQQLAFQVDLDACTGCKACVAACHSMNGLAPEETWRDVGLVIGDGDGGVQQTVTTACHHCEDPACLSGCPVKAYEKDPVTGIVRHLDDQCIGCQYCILKCPYDVPKFSEELKIVRKCDMCTGRLAANESPACVQDCPTGAISITIVDLADGDAPAELISGLADAIPDSAISRPTTRYVSRRPPTSLRPANADRVNPSPAHDPLAIMLVLLQLSVGSLGIGLGASLAGFISGPASSAVLLLAAVTAMMGLGAATLHLGRPLYAFRAFLGWRTSWMSREIVVLGVYVPMVAMAAVAVSVVQFGSVLDLDSSGLFRMAKMSQSALQLLAVLTGALGIGCSAMIYIDTRRAAWSFSRTVPLFIGSLLMLGAFGVAAAIAAVAVFSEGGAVGQSIPFLVSGLVVLGMKLRFEAALRSPAKNEVNQSTALANGARLLRGPLRRRSRVRIALAAIGASSASVAVAMVALGGYALATSMLVGVSLLLCTAGEFLERHLYFTAEASPSMPGH